MVAVSTMYPKASNSENMGIMSFKSLGQV